MLYLFGYIAMRAGAFDFIPKPFSPEHLSLVIRKVLEYRVLKQENTYLHGEVDAPYREIVGTSPHIREAVETARKVAAASSTVLMLGETGTGKEIFARSMHRWSPRSRAPFVVVNCVALSDELLESELFGHEKGAFTGAHQVKLGKLEIANGGTVFFDEIGDMKRNSGPNCSRCSKGTTSNGSGAPDALRSTSASSPPRIGT